MRMLCGKVEKVNYSNVCDMVIMSVRIGGSKRLKDIVGDLSRYMNKCLDIYRIKDMLNKEGYVIEKLMLNDDILKVEDWVVIKNE
jgi:hypothetical protein